MGAAHDQNHPRVMSDKARPDSQKSRQELLDEIYYLRDVAGEREQQVRERNTELASLRGQLALALRNRSWRLTASLRWLTRALVRSRHLGTARVIDTSPHEAASSLDWGDRETPQKCLALESSTVEARGSDGKHFYVDITELALRQGKTGVQRVTREILAALLATPPDGYAVRPVYAAPGQPYRLAERFVANLLGTVNDARPDAVIDPRAGDVFLGLDHSMHAVTERASDLDAIHRRGVRIWFECNDTLPLDHPEWFPADVQPKFEAWLRTVLNVADGVACISRATETALHRWFNEWKIQREHPLALSHFPLGADIVPRAPVTVTDKTSVVLKCLQDKPVLLMVGTIEPRKGHAQALEAFNWLWAHGDDVALVIVGPPGWMTEVVQRRIRHHDEFGQRLFWFMDADDTLLDKLYAACTVLLAPSEGEGYGLPLVEAARHGLPVLCRDLPVFREVAGEHASYFTGLNAESLAAAIHDWLEAWQRRTVPASRGMPWFTWAESARQLIDVVLADRKTVQSLPPSS